MAQALAQARKGFQHTFVSPVALATGSGAGRHLEVFDHAEVAEDAAALGHISDAQLGNFVGFPANHRFADDVHRA